MDGIYASPMTATLDSDKTVLVQSGLSLARDNPSKDRKMVTGIGSHIFLVHKT